MDDEISRFRLVDFARISEDTVPETADNLIRHKFRNTPRWNYNPSRKRMPYVLVEATSRDDAKASVVGLGPEKGWPYNSEVCDLTYRYLRPRVSECFEVDNRLIHIRSNVALKIELTTGIVLDGMAALLWMQPCKTEMLPFNKYGLFGSVEKFALQESDFSSLDSLYWDLSAYKNRRRRTRLIKRSNLKLWSYERLSQQMDIFLQAFDMINSMSDEVLLARYEDLKGRR